MNLATLNCLCQKLPFYPSFQYKSVVNSAAFLQSLIVQPDVLNSAAFLQPLVFKKLPQLRMILITHVSQ